MEHQDTWMLAVLCSSPIAVEAVSHSLGSAAERKEVRHQLPVRPAHSLVARSEGITVIVDVYDHRWLDFSGHEEGSQSSVYTHLEEHEHLLAPPWSLKRAVQQYRAADDANIAAANHGAYILLRVPLQPEGQTIEAFQRLLDVASDVLKVKQADCIFNPRGETLGGRDRFGQMKQRYREEGLPPLELLANARFHEIGAGWCMIDTVGLHQLDLPDQEIIFHPEHLPQEEAIHFARNLAMHFLVHRPHVTQGETASGPHETIWEAMPVTRGALPPHRKAIRWLPEDSVGMPLGMTVP